MSASNPLAELLAGLASALSVTESRWHLEEAFLDRAVVVDVDGVAIPVIAPEDLVVTKVLAGRPKDLEDVRGILAERRDRLDAEAIRATLRRLEEALGQGDLLPLFEAEWSRGEASG